MSKEVFGDKEKRRPRAWVVFGGPGHEGEYVFTVEKDLSVYEIGEIDSALSEELGDDWGVSNRGTRLEIINKKKYGARDDRTIREALEKVLDPEQFELVDGK